MVGEQQAPPAREQSGEELAEGDWLSDAESENGGVRAAISNVMVGLKKQFYGKGPERVKTYINDEYALCVLEGVLTRNERTLIQNGDEDLVRSYRLRFQEAMTKPVFDALERATGRKVVGYHSQIIFEPERAFEVIVFAEPLQPSRAQSVDGQG
jgi:uncharacterized protein YbcI